jgi:structure-specific endonuclease subunit SLX1
VRKQREKWYFKDKKQASQGPEPVEDSNETDGASEPDRTLNVPASSSQTDPPNSKRMGKKPKREKKNKPYRPLTKRWEDLHVLLRTKYFCRWPLTVRFQVPDVYVSWKAYSDRIDTLLPDIMQVKLDQTHFGGVNTLYHRLPANDMSYINATHDGLKPVQEKAVSVIADSETLLCGVCAGKLSTEEHLIAICTQKKCRSASHVTCLSKLFLTAEGRLEEFIPTSGTCPVCGSEITWSSLMKELSLRLRGGTEAKSRSKTAHRPKTTAKKLLQNATDHDITPFKNMETDNKLLDPEVDHLDESWIEEIDGESDTDSHDKENTESNQAPARVEIVIDDSEWDEFD